VRSTSFCYCLDGSFILLRPREDDGEVQFTWQDSLTMIFRKAVVQFHGYECDNAMGRHPFSANYVYSRVEWGWIWSERHTYVRMMKLYYGHSSRERLFTRVPFSLIFPPWFYILLLELDNGNGYDDNDDDDDDL